MPTSPTFSSSPLRSIICKHDKQRAVVFFDLRPLMAMLGVFQGEIVQAEFFLHRLKLFRCRDR